MRVLISLTLLVSFLAIAQSGQTRRARVPYIGCPADGQLGPQVASSGQPKALPISQAMATQLAWYQYQGEAGQIGALAPRGWSCFATIGSNGMSLYVAPEPVDAAKVLEHKGWKGFSGPALQLSESEGGTSGRFEVAQVIARVFPAHRAFARRVIAEMFQPASDFPFGPFPSDKLTYRSKELVEYTTPAQRKGLGTMSWLLPSDRRISGMASLSTKGDVELLHLSVRLPATQEHLVTVLIQNAERQSSAP